jgi:hypothetical protein
MLQRTAAGLTLGSPQSGEMTCDSIGGTSLRFAIFALRLTPFDGYTIQPPLRLPGLVAMSPTIPPSAVVARASGASAAFFW